MGKVMRRTTKGGILGVASLTLLAAAAAAAVGAVGASEASKPTAGVPTGRVAPAVVDEAAGLFTIHELDAGYAKVAVDYERQRVDVLWKGDVPREIVEAADDAAELGVEVGISDAPYSEQDIADAAARIFQSSPETVSVVLPNDDRTGLIVELAPNAKTVESDAKAADAYERLGGVPTVVRTGGEKPVLASRQNMGAPFKGGGAMANANGNDYCSTAFAVLLPGGAGRLLSAFHCNNAVGDTIRDGVGQVIGPVSNRYNVLDSELIDPNASPATTGQVFSGPWTSSTLKNVGGATAPAVNQTVCTSGARSGEHCNLTVSATGVTWGCVGATCTGFISRAADLSAVIAGGDSGGPVYAYRSDGRVGARGVMSAGQYERPCGPTAEPAVCQAYAYSVSIVRILDHWNATIEENP